MHNCDLLPYFREEPSLLGAEVGRPVEVGGGAPHQVAVEGRAAAVPAGRAAAGCGRRQACPSALLKGSFVKPLTLGGDSLFFQQTGLKV